MWHVWEKDRCIQGFGEETSVNENTRKIDDDITVYLKEIG